jgi:hypothetical protein
MSWWTRLRSAVIDPVVNEAERAVDTVSSGVSKVGDEFGRLMEDPVKVAALAAAVVAGPEILAAYGPEAGAAAGAGEAAGVAGASELGASFAADMAAAGYGSTAAGAGLTLADIAAGAGTAAETIAPIVMAPENAALLSSMGPETASALGQSFAGDMASAGYMGADLGTQVGAGLGAESTSAAAQNAINQGAILPETAPLAPDAVSTASNIPATTVEPAVPYAAGPNAIGPQTAAELGKGFQTAMDAAGVASSPTLGSMFKSGWDTVNKPLWEGGLSARQGFTGLQLAGGLYDMYAKNQMAKSQQEQADQIKQQIAQASNMYAPGSPEYKMLMDKLARLDAKAGRNSQYATREQSLASLIAQQKASMAPNISSMTNMANQIQNQALQNRYGSVNSLMSLAGKTAAPTVVNTLGGS